MASPGIVGLKGAAGRRSTPDLIADALRAAIVDGRIAGGAQLKQNEIAAEFGVSVVPVREAFQRLVADGMATLAPNRGVTVSRLSEADFQDIAELRALLEPHALRLSAPALTADDLARAAATLRAAASATDPAERARLHWDFHRALYARADRPRLLAQIDGLYVNISRYLSPLWQRVGLSPGWVESHMTIVDAIARGDVDAAARLVTEQIFEASGRVRDILRARDGAATGKGR
ncbi:MAG: GntR family transcriptional regulator [Alphaproteobacteria bacterium]|nr:GntR family transcriptional regulator [Alphaproteobacteria bacterium]